MTAILFVRIETELEAKEVEQQIDARLPQFRDVPGLQQKYFGRDPETGNVCGIYLFKDQTALTNYRQSELAHSIPGAYEAIEVRRETFDLVRALVVDRDD